MSQRLLAGRSYANVYRVVKRADVHSFVIDAVDKSGGEVLYASQPSRAPIYLGIQTSNDDRLGVLCYPFRCNAPPIRGRKPDEHRIQIRYGGEVSWDEKEHPLGRDIAGVDTTIVLGVHLGSEFFVGLDPLRYDPLPMGISVEFKDQDVRESLDKGWHVWERERRPGRRRGKARVGEGLETLIGFTPDRLLDYIKFERQADGLGLDSPLRYRAAEAATSGPVRPAQGGSHRLEKEFDLSSEELLEMIAARTRLTVAVRGGVAERHLSRHLNDDTSVRHGQLIDLDGQPDFEVVLVDGRECLVECKNVSPKTYADGTPKVEVQKTRSQQDPAGRFYRPDQFDVVAACLYPVTGQWEFRFKATTRMDRHQRHPERLAVLHRVDESWSETLTGALDAQSD